MSDDPSPMDNETLTALIAGAEKWDRNVKAIDLEDAEIYSDSCELCAMFLDKECDGCPIMQSTGVIHCLETPWVDASRMFDRWRQSFFSGDTDAAKNARDSFRIASKAESEFLWSLVPMEAK